MYETTRHQYLAAMGIDSYMPRCLLPNAPAPFECEWPPGAAGVGSEPAGQPAIEASVAVENYTSSDSPALTVSSDSDIAPVENTVVERPAKGGAGAAELLAGFEPESSRKKSSPSKAKEVKAESSLIEQPAEALRFSLSVWRFDELLVVDSRHSEKALPTEKLLLSMLQAYGLKLGNLPKPQVLQWPMFDMPQAETGAEAAREMLGAFLETLLDKPLQDWWLMGTDAFHLLPPETLAKEHNGYAQLITAEQLQGASVSPAAQLITMPSLAEMLERPQLKAKAWQAMKQTMSVGS